MNTAETGRISAYQTTRSDGLMPDQTMSAAMKMVSNRGMVCRFFCIRFSFIEGREDGERVSDDL